MTVDTTGRTPSVLRALGPFAVRLRDLLATLESTALLGAAGSRVRGLGEQLRFACISIPCDEAIVALEIETLGRLSVPVVADAAGHRAVELDFLPTGTPFAYLLGGGGGHVAEIEDGDALAIALAPVLAKPPRSGVFVPIRLGESTLGGAVLLSHEASLGDRELELGERLSEVLALTVEGFRTERVLFELFARALPDLFAADAATSFRDVLAKHVRALRVLPAYRRRLELALAVGKLADRGDAEAALAASIAERIDAYVGALTGAPPVEDEGL